MTEQELTKMEALAAAATPGPWHHESGRMVRCRPGGDTVPARTTADAAFIAAAREVVPALCAEVRRLQAEVSRVRARTDGMEPTS